MDDPADPRSFSLLLEDLKTQTQEFVQTRLAMLKAEMREKGSTLKLAAPLFGVALVLVLTAYSLATLALAALIAASFPNNPYRWVLGFGGIAVIWLIAGIIAALIAKREFKIKRLIPSKTIEVLKGDKLWIENEARNKYERRAG